MLLRTLGSPALLAADRTVLLGPGKGVALLTYLATCPGRTASRDLLIELLWAEGDSATGRRNLRQTLHQLRSIPPLSEWLEAEADRLILRAGLATDRDQLMLALERSELAAACALYSGPFFEAFAAPGAASFEQWADLERQRLASAVMRAREMIIHEALRTSRYREALVHARELRDSNPASESGWRLLLQAAVAAGDTITSVAEAAAFDEHFRSRGTRLDPSTIEVLAAIRRLPLGPRDDQRFVAEMIGREREFAALLEQLHAIRQGGFAVTQIEGRPGIGKTRLLSEFAQRVAALGMPVVSVQAAQLGQDIPWSVAATLVRDLATCPGSAGVSPVSSEVLVGLEPSLSERYPESRPTAQSTGELFRLRCSAIHDLVEAVAYERPVVLLIDNLHWADTPSVAVLASLAARRPARLLIVAAGRGGVQPLTADPTVIMPTLREEHVLALLQSLATLPDDLRQSQLASDLHRATDGVPLLVLETLRLAEDNTLLQRTQETWQSPDIDRLSHWLAARHPLEGYTVPAVPAERRLLLVMASAGVPLAADSLPNPEYISRLEARGLVHRLSDRLTLSHDLLGEHILASASTLELADAHQEASRLLAAAAIDESGLRFAARHAMKSAEPAVLTDIYRRYVLRRRQAHDRRAAPELARELLGDAATAAQHRLVLSSLPWRLRWPHRLLPLGAAAAISIMTLGGWTWLRQPVALRVAMQPRLVTELPDRRPLVIEIIDRSGRLSQTNDSIRLSVSPGLHLRGTTTVAATDGRAVFNAFTIEADSLQPADLARLTAHADHLTPATSDSVIAGPGAQRLRIIELHPLDAAVASGTTTLRVHPGRRVQFDAVVRYTTLYPKAAVLLTLIPSWSDRRISHQPLLALAPDAVDESARIRVDIAGPSRPGRHWLMLVAAAETQSAFVASATNWTVGRPVWGDGNDLADMSASASSEIANTGLLVWPWTYASGRAPVRLPATAIEIIVE